MSKDPMLLTKLAGAVLVTAWIGVAAGFASWLLYRPDSGIETPAYPLLDTEAVDKRPSAAETPAVEPAPATASEGEAAPAAAADGEDIATLLAAADAAAGQKEAKKCAACHTLDKGGKNKVGPNLWDVVDRQVGAAEGYKYSTALAHVGGTWSYEKLDAFLTSPRDFANGTRMTFAGIKDGAERADLIAYLRSLSDNPKPLP